MSDTLHIGSIIDCPQNKDAIHVAVAPLTATSSMLPGCSITTTDGIHAVVCNRDAGIGVVDPFLSKAVIKRERFWAFLKPGSIKSLRHDWTHPAFEHVAEVPTGETPAQVESRRWIEGFAVEIDQTYNRLMSAAQYWIECEEYTSDNSERYKDHWDKFPEFWKHYEIVTGTTVKDKQSSFFTCSC